MILFLWWQEFVSDRDGVQKVSKSLSNLILIAYIVEGQTGNVHNGMF